MTLEDMKTLLAGRLGQRTDIDDMIYREIRQAQRVLEKTPPYPWFLGVADQYDWSARVVEAPDGFIELIEDFLLILKATADTAYYGVPYKIYGGYIEHTATVGPEVLGRPKNFGLGNNRSVGLQIAFSPAPDKSYNIHLYYYKEDAILAGPTSENLWSTKGEDILIAEAGWHVARNIRDNEAAAMFGQDRAEARRRMAQESTSRLEAMRRAVIGSGEDALLGQRDWEFGHQ